MILRRWLPSDFIYALVFLYFLTLSADLLHVEAVFFRIKINHFLALILSFSVLLFYKKIRIDRSLFFASLLIFTSIVVSSTLSYFPRRSFYYIYIYLFYLFCYFVVPLNLMRLLDVQKLLRLYGWAFCLNGFYALMQFLLSLEGVILPFSQQRIGSYVRPNALAHEPSYYALYMTAFVMFMNARYLLGEGRLRKPRFFLQFILLNLFLCISFSASGFLAYFILFALAVLLCFSKLFNVNFSVFRRRCLAFFSFFLVLTFTTMLSIKNLFLSYFLKIFTAQFYEHVSFLVRWEGIVNALQVFFVRPFWGIGLGSVGPYIQDLKNPNVGASSLFSFDEIDLYDPTNMFTEMLASLGLFGFSAFIFLIGIFARKLKKMFHLQQISLEQKQIGCALFISLIVMIMELQTNQALFRSYIWVHAAITYGFLSRITQNASREGRVASSC